MKTVVLALCLLIPVSTWAQTEGEVEPQHLKMLKAANEAEGKGKVP